MENPKLKLSGVTKDEVFHKCVICKKQYKYTQDLERHMQKHETKPVQYAVCKKIMQWNQLNTKFYFSSPASTS